MISSLLDERFTDPVAASEYLESIRWPDGVVCPHCGESEREPYRLKGKSLKHRRVWKCRTCRKQFTVHGRDDLRVLATCRSTSG